MDEPVQAPVGVKVNEAGETPYDQHTCTIGEALLQVLSVATSGPHVKVITLGLFKVAVQDGYNVGVTVTVPVARRLMNVLGIMPELVAIVAPLGFLMTVVYEALLGEAVTTSCPLGLWQ